MPRWRFSWLDRKAPERVPPAGPPPASPFQWRCKCGYEWPRCSCRDGAVMPRCHVITVNPGDVIVIESPRPMSRAAFERLKAQIKAAIPEARAVILEDGLKMHVESLDEDEAHENWLEEDALRSILP